MKKHILAATVMLAVLALVTGCTVSNYVFVGSVEVYGNDFWTIRYSKFQGNKKHEMTLKGGEEHTITVDIVTDAGTLDLDITAKDGTSVYSGKALATSAFEIEAVQDGEYVIQFTGNEHSGSFHVGYK